MNRRNWLKTLAALAAGMLGMPWTAKERLARGGCRQRVCVMTKVNQLDRSKTWSG